MLERVPSIHKPLGSVSSRGIGEGGKDGIRCDVLQVAYFFLIVSHMSQGACADQLS